MTSTGSSAAFDVTGPLPHGTVVLEASAGTGKTYAIEALAVRYVAEGVAPLEELLLITFGRNATAELRERVRRRFVSVTRALAAGEGAAGPDADPLQAHLSSGTDADVAARLRRLRTALVAFDAATIETTHGFCNQMLGVLGLAGDTDPSPTLIEDSSEVVAEVVTDLYLDRYGRPHSPQAQLTHDKALALANLAVAYPDAAIEPVGAEPGSAPDERVALTIAARAEVTDRKRRRGLRDYDDMLVQLRDALHAPGLAEIARHRLRARFRIVLVDEFQDTDPVQWDILRTAFHGHATLVLVGDPKQAIYAFRGADVVTYLKATAVADRQWTLGVNHRSDEALVSAGLHLLDGVTLGEDIGVPRVQAAHRGTRLTGAPRGAPLRLRVVDRTQVPVVKGGLTKTDATRAMVAADVARDIVALLGSGATYHPGSDPGSGSRPVGAGDVAVLVRTNDQGVRVRDALTAAGVPVTLSGAASVFRSPAAADWLTVLQAVEAPHRSGLVARAALTVFVGWTATSLGTAPPEHRDALAATVRDWGRVLERRGVPALAEVMSASFDLPRRVLSAIGGERFLTDIRHVAQALHVAAVEGERGVAELTAWLHSQIAEAAGDPSEERSQRLDSDAQAVQVLTIHRSKGSQYPIVYVPFLWDRFAGRVPDPLRFHDSGGRRVLDVGGPGSPRPAAWTARADAEQFGEDLRLLYVAFTRAGSQVVAWWAPSSTTTCSPLHRVLFGEPVAGALPHEVAVPTDAQARQHLDGVAARAGGAMAIEAAAAGPVPRLPPASVTPARVSVRTFERAIAGDWQRTSYTRITAAVHEAQFARSEPEGSFHDDETPATPGEAPFEATPIDGAAVAANLLQTDLRETVSPLAAFPGGAAFGTFVHTVLDGADMTAPDLLRHLNEKATDVGGRLGGAVVAAELAAALVSVVETPLGPLAGGSRLRDIARSDRLDELAFELPLAGGDRAGEALGKARSSRPAEGATVAAIVTLLRRHLSPGDPLAAYADSLAVPALAGRRLLGYLTGSIDSVLRMRDGAGAARYLVVDYKTNWLGESRAVPLTAWHYRPAALAAEMIHAHYPLQALLYCAALHRYLRHRQPGYRPEQHLGGVLYLFVRGMCGAGTPVVAGTPTGVFSWRPPAVLVVELSDLLDRGTL